MRRVIARVYFIREVWVVLIDDLEKNISCWIITSPRKQQGYVIRTSLYI